MNIEFPANFVTPELAGKKAVYSVDIVEVKEKVLPSLDEKFVKGLGAESLEALRAGVRRDLENELNYKQSKSIRNQRGVQMQSAAIPAKSLSNPASRPSANCRDVLGRPARAGDGGLPKSAIKKN